MAEPDGARREVGRLMHAGQRKQAERWVRKLRTWTGRLTRDIERNQDGQELAWTACLAFSNQRGPTGLNGLRNGSSFSAGDLRFGESSPQQASGFV
jgi:hypothetical protein